MIPLPRAGLVLALALAAAPAGAQHDHAAPGPHGGRVQDAGPWHAELVTRGETVAVYLSDGDGRPLKPAGFTGVAILKGGAKAARIPLAPEGDRLAGRAEADLGARPAGALRLTGPGGATASARFE